MKVEIRARLAYALNANSSSGANDRGKPGGHGASGDGRGRPGGNGGGDANGGSGDAPEPAGCLR